MLLHILAVGDVVSERGLDCLHHHLRALKKEHDIHFTVVNGENAAGLGLLPRHADEHLSTPEPTSSPWATTPGAGSRSRITWTRTPYILRPANYRPPVSPAGASACLKAPRGFASVC